MLMIPTGCRPSWAAIPGGITVDSAPVSTIRLIGTIAGMFAPAFLSASSAAGWRPITTSSNGPIFGRPEVARMIGGNFSRALER